jgi:hypothetical protein
VTMEMVLGIDLSSAGPPPALMMGSASLPSLLSGKLAGSLSANSPGWATPTATQVCVDRRCTEHAAYVCRQREGV